MLIPLLLHHQALLQALASSAGGAAGSASTVTAPSGEAISAATSIVETLQVGWLLVDIAV